ncbi:MAG TPA: FMN-binding protein [Gemmatimonadales bacterium]|nr:FMN-binding protein [Gemmatimonadales bacterium]
MLTLHRLPRAYRVLYLGIALLLGAALLSHWARLSLRHGVTPAAVEAWYRGDETAMLFRKTGVEVAEDAWMNLFHHTLAFLVLGGLLVRTAATPRTKAALGALFGAGTLVSAAGPPLVWWAVPGAATVYLGALAALSAIALAVSWLVLRDALLRRAAGHRGVRGSDVLAAGRLGRRATVVATFLAVWPAAGLEAQAGVYLTEREAIREVFPAARLVVTDTIRPDSAAAAALEQALGRPIESPVVVRRLYLPPEPSGPPGGGTGQRLRAPRLVGYSLVTEERGKYRPITMLIGVDTAFRVAGVRILVYREPRGGEVARQYFLRQYRGKGVGDPIRLNRDIINISGATISVHSVNAGVKKTLALIQHYYRGREPEGSRSPLPLEEVVP